MGKNVTPDNVALRERLLQMLTECYPERRTTTVLVDTCGMWRTTWTWCDGGSACYVVKDLLNQLPTHVRGPVDHFHPHQGVRTGKTAEGKLLGYDTFQIAVSYQVVYPQLNALAKLGKVEKHDVPGGLVSWSAIDDGLLAAREAEALDILRATLERVERQREEHAAETLAEAVEQGERITVGFDPGRPNPEEVFVAMVMKKTGEQVVVQLPPDDPRERLARNFS